MLRLLMMSLLIPLWQHYNLDLIILEPTPHAAPYILYYYVYLIINIMRCQVLYMHTL